MARCEKIFIAGFSGSGKSSLLKHLSPIISDDWALIDLDQSILGNYPQFSTLSELIEHLGWDKFRLIERQGIEGFLKMPGPGVMALGGGAFTALLWQMYGQHPKIKFCYLKTDFEECWDRLIQDIDEPRPLVQRGKSELFKIYEQRRMLFNLIPWKLENESGESLSKLAQKFWDKIQ